MSICLRIVLDALTLLHRFVLTFDQYQHLSFHQQLIESMEEGKVVVALGGGRRNFQTVENGGRREDLKDLVNRFNFVNSK